MKPAEISVLLPLYRIESDVTYHTERKPTVFERMVLRLCDPGLHVPDKQNLSLLDVFRDQLGAGDVRELLEGCVSELSALGALPKRYALDTLEMPLTELELTTLGLQFLRSDSLPVRSRTVKVWHRYDPISDEIKSAQNDGAHLSQSDFSRVSVADQALRPRNPLPLVERAITQETYNWKTPATVIDHIVPVVQLSGWGEQRKLEISFSEDGVLSASAPCDAALQRWLEQAQPELVWEILLADTLTSEPNSLLPIVDSSVLRDASTARPIAAATKGGATKARLCIVAQGVAAADTTTPTIVLSSEVAAPELVSNGKQPSVFTLLVPTPDGMITGFRSLSLPQIDGASVQVEIAGNLCLYWAGQPRSCGLAVTLNDQAAAAFWAKLRRDLEDTCEHSDDPCIAFMSLAWRDADALGEKVWQWLFTRAKQSLDDLMALVEPTTQAIGLWRPNRKDWESAWEKSFSRAIDESLRHTPKQLDPEKVASLLIQMAQAQVLSADKAAALLRHVAPIRTVDSLAKLRSALPSFTEIPEELLSVELRQVWLEHALQRKELKLYGPHAIQQPMQFIEKVVQDIYRNIGDQALKAAGNGQMDVRTLTPHALDAVRAWRKAAEHFHALNTSSFLWDALNKAVESWNLLAQDKLAPVENGRRVVVFDTSALMERPELLQDLRSDDILVVPHRVLSELDGLKGSEDEARAVKARAAIRHLDANSSHIRHEKDYTALLPAEWDVKQPDHAILSTALFFRLNDVLFVSNDINLRNKAKSLGLNAQDSKSYVPSWPVPPAASDIQSRKQDKKQRQ